jgi:predicted small metal-binding protein
MKQFRCADIVPGCSATVRLKHADDVVSTALGHLISVHGLDESNDLAKQVVEHMTNVNPLRALFDRH